MVYSKIIRCTSIAYFKNVMLETLLIIVNVIVNSNDKFSKILLKLQQTHTYYLELDNTPIHQDKME